MKSFSLFLSILFLVCGLSAQSQQWSRVCIYTGESGLTQLAQAGICVDHGVVKHGHSFITDLSQAELVKVNQLGLNYDIVIADVQAHYIHQNDPECLAQSQVNSQVTNCTAQNQLPTPTNFSLGSMGGFFTYSEILWHLDNMATLYPNLVKPRAAIDSTITTAEGRYVYWMKLSDNPSTDEVEPEMLYTAAHHAREPAGVSQLILYMYYLLENYATNPEIQYLINNTELYFVPCINPDGYIYNETTNPLGGGMWRKNRRDNLDGSYGVDLNRNYGYNWGYDDIGSSPNTIDNTYRGTSDFSEPETQLIRQMCTTHNFRIVLNYHTFSNVLICPWGYAPQIFTPDSALYAIWGRALTIENDYVFGTVNQTLGYIANGVSDDWMYGEQTLKPKIMAMTPEAGDQVDGFWPAQNRIIDICKINIPMDLNAARLILAYGIVNDRDDRYLRQLSGHLHFDFQRLGLDTTPTYTVSITPISTWMTAVGPSRTYTSFNLLQSATDSIAYTLNPSTPAGTAISYIIAVNNGTFTWQDTITKIYGATNILLANSGGSTIGWTALGNWNTTSTQYRSAPSSITDSPFGNYGAGDYNIFTVDSTIDLSNALSAQLSFYTRFEIEPGYDFAQAEVSTDNGASWTALCGHYTTNNNNLDNGNPIWTGFQTGWVKEQLSLDNYLGQQILIRFRLLSDWGNEFDGFFFDDLLAESIDTTISSLGVNELSLLQISQNMPNPADEYTYINLGRMTTNGILEVYSSVGELVVQIPVNTGDSVLRMNTDQLPSGVYFYRLAVNNKFSETKRMQVIR